jgi:tetratricopeptide (TPR) repeat protein
MPKGKKPAGKKPALIRTASGFGMKQVDFAAELRRIDRLFMDDDNQQAYNQIHALCRRYPDQIELHQRMAHIALELEDMQGYGRACAQLMPLQPKNPNHVYGFVSSLMNGAHAVLTWQMLKQAIALDPDNDLVTQAEESIAFLDNSLDELLAPTNLPRDEAIAMMTIHEWAQVYLAWGEYDKCRELELQVLELKPDLMPALNNLSLVAFIQNDLPTAIAQSEQVLTIEPENIHALSNLVRYCILSGDRPRAQAFADRLKVSQADAWDPWSKKIEGLSYVGDDVAIITLWETLTDQESEKSTITSIALHLVAVALARQGEIEQARPIWQRALSREPGLAIAQANLHNCDKPLAQRHRAWPFSVDFWMTETMRQDLVKGLTPIRQAEKTGKLGGFCRQYFEQHPQTIDWIELMLDRGDPTSSQMALDLAKNAETPQLWEIVRAFALGQNGSDGLRNDAAIALVRANQLDPEKVRMWLNGAWQEISLITYEFHEDQPFEHSPKVLKLIEQALTLLRTGTPAAGIAAEALLQEALAITTAPDLLNNLAVAYLLQDREAEGIDLCRQIVADYPTYIPARVSIARFHLLKQETDVAAALLQPILKQSRFHIEDLATFSEGYLLLLVQQQELVRAQGWLQLWTQVTPDHPRVEFWQQQLGLLTAAQKMGMVADGIPKRKRLV